MFAPVYLDHNATTPLHAAVREAMLPWLGGPGEAGFGNPHSPHRLGRSAKAAIEHARDQVAALLPDGGRVIFTGSACEAINLAMRGVSGEGPIAYSAIEHPAVRDTARGEVADWPVYDREGFAPGAVVAGPCIVAEAETSTLVGPGWSCRMDGLGYLELTR